LDKDKVVIGILDGRISLKEMSMEELEAEENRFRKTNFIESEKM
jgi:hypothetical protein